ncbi:MAG: 4Fe-4S binding protein [bacterium]
MKKIVTGMLYICLVACVFPCPAFGVRRVSPPEFESGYTLPTPITPAPRNPLYEYVDVLVLFCTLLLAAYYALKSRSRQGIFLLMLFCILYFGFWKKGCVCSVGSIQNVALALFHPAYSLPLSVLLFFMLPLLAALFFGRVFCGAVCPIGALQDIVAFHPLKVPQWADHALSLVPAVYLGIAVLYAATGSHFLICRFDPAVSFFRLTGPAPMLFFGALFLCVSMCVARPYCRFLCPYGVLLRWCSRLSKWHIAITPDECIQCRLCEESCPFGAIKKPREECRGQSRKELRRTLLLIVALPLIIALGAVIGRTLAFPLSYADARVRLAEQLWREDSGKEAELTLESETFRSMGRQVADLYKEVRLLQKQFQVGGMVLGGFLGLTFGGTLIFLSLCRKGSDYEPDRGLCLSCGRCFAYCPREHLRLKTGKEKNEAAHQNS